MSGRIVVIKSLTTKYKTVSFYSAPHSDPNRRGQYLLGQKHLPAEFKNSQFKVKKEDRPAVSHAMPLDLSQEADACLYAYFLDTEEIANRLAEALPEKHFFYIEDPEEEAKIQNKSDELLMDAFELLASNSSNEARDNILYYLGIDPRGKSDPIKKQLVMSTAKSDPQKIKNAFSKSAKFMQFVNRLYVNNIIKQKNNVYYFDETVLGTGMDEVVLFVMNEKNAKVVESLGTHLDSAEGKTGRYLAETMSITFIDGEVKELSEKQIDELLAEYNVSPHPMAKLPGKVKSLQKHFDGLKD